MITKVMPNCEHSGCSISEKYYDGEQMKLAGTGQGNNFSGDMC